LPAGARLRYEGDVSDASSRHRRRDAARRRPSRSGRSGGPGDGIDRLSGVHCVREALRARRRELYRLWVDREARRGETASACALAEEIGVPVSELSREELLERLDPASRRSNPQGLLLEAGPLPAVALAELLEALPDGGGRLVALDGVEDPQNVGALVRVAEASGAKGLILSERRAPPLGPAVARASSGALEWLPVARVTNLARALDACRDAGAWVVGADPAAEQSVFAVSDRLLSGRVVVLLGAEGHGIRAEIRKRIDHPVALPMRGHVASLNVSAAGAVLLYELLRREAGQGSG
jgi:23S rRNA (guanosine2251-2'-O)-methyltransferase